MDFRCPWGRIFLPSGTTYRVLTCNLDGNACDPIALATLIRRETPDFIALQECRSDFIQAAVEGYQIVECGELLVASRFPLHEEANASGLGSAACPPPDTRSNLFRRYSPGKTALWHPASAQPALRIIRHAGPQYGNPTFEKRSFGGANPPPPGRINGDRRAREKVPGADYSCRRLQHTRGKRHLSRRLVVISECLFTDGIRLRPNLSIRRAEYLSACESTIFWEAVKSFPHGAGLVLRLIPIICQSWRR